MSEIKENQVDDIMDYTVFTVPKNRAWILTKEEAEDFLKNMPTRKITKEERAEFIRETDKLFKKPEKKLNE